MGDIESTTYPTRERWLKARQGAIGASSAAAALGLSPWQSPFDLYLSLTGEKPPQEETDAMRAGRILEPAVAQFFQEDTGRSVWAPSESGLTIFKNADLPFLAATPDRFQNMQGKEGDGNLQLKTSSGFNKHEWDEGAIPVQYEVQVNIEMLCTGLSWGSISVLFDGRTHEYRDYVLLESGEQEAVLKVLEEFWQRVQTGTPPDPDHRDLDAVKALFPTADPEKVLALTAEQAMRFDALWAQRSTYAQEARDAEKMKVDAEAKIRLELGENEEAHAPDGAVYRLPTTEVAAKTVERAAYSFRKLSRRAPKQ